MDIFDHELGAYDREIKIISKELKEFRRGEFKVDNLTHYGLALSNRVNLLVVGLCSLVEVIMYELAHDENKKNALKLENARGQGLSKFKAFLSDTKRVNFGTLKGWDKFMKIYDLRNSIVHSYGGLVETRQLESVKKAVKALDIEHTLVGEKRIRLSIEIVNEFHSVINNVVYGLKKYT